ncbi:MAG: hypothetical protein AAGJ10_15825 [Bacteroidota bacterium]
MITGPDPGTVEVTAPAKRYTLDPETVIEVTVENQTADTLYYSSCEAAALQRIKSGRVERTWGQGACLCICIRELPPGADVVYTYPLSVLYEFVPDALQEGTYRLLLPPLYTTPPDYDVRFEGLVSSRFELEAP